MNAILALLLSLLVTIARPIQKLTGFPVVTPTPTVSVAIASPSATPVIVENIIINSKLITPTIVKTPNFTTTPTPSRTVTNSDISIQFISPTSSEVFKADQTIGVEMRVQGDVAKVELYAASGILTNTFSTSPYKTNINLATYVHGITTNYKLPLGAKAYRKDGSSVYTSLDLNIIPVNATNPTSAPTPSKSVAHKQLEFTRDPQSSNAQARAEGEFTVEQYDSFTNMTSIKTSGKAYELKSNTEYEVFVITKKGTISIGSLNTDGNGYGEFSTGLGTDQYYCDIYSLGIKQKSVSDSQTVLWGGQLVDSCPKG